MLDTYMHRNMLAPYPPVTLPSPYVAAPGRVHRSTALRDAVTHPAHRHVEVHAPDRRTHASIGRSTMRTSPRTTSVEARLERGFRFEVLRHGSTSGFVPEPVDLRVLPDPREAIRAIRVPLRASHVLGLTPRETARALYWADQGGWVQALGALHRGEPCGFTLMLRKRRHIEWNVRPLLHLTLRTAAPPSRAR